MNQENQVTLAEVFSARSHCASVLVMLCCCTRTRRMLRRRATCTKACGSWSTSGCARRRAELLTCLCPLRGLAPPPHDGETCQEVFQDLPGLREALGEPRWTENALGRALAEPPPARPCRRHNGQLAPCCSTPPAERLWLDAGPRDGLELDKRRQKARPSLSPCAELLADNKSDAGELPSRDNSRLLIGRVLSRRAMLGYEVLISVLTPHM